MSDWKNSNKMPFTQLASFFQSSFFQSKLYKLLFGRRNITFGCPDCKHGNQSVCLSPCPSIYLSLTFTRARSFIFSTPPPPHPAAVVSSPIYPSLHSFISVWKFLMTAIQHNALLRQTRSMDAWWSAPLSNLAATWTNWFSDRLKKIKPAIKTSRKVLNGPYVHNKLSYVFFPSFSPGHPSCLHWQVTGHANVTLMTTGLCPSCYFDNFARIV